MKHIYHYALCFTIILVYLCVFGYTFQLINRQKRHLHCTTALHYQTNEKLQETLQTILSSDSKSIKESLDSLKFKRELNIWSSTMIEPKKVTKSDLLLISRVSFDTKDLFADIMNKVQKQSQQSSANKSSLILISIICFVMTSVIIPQLQISLVLKNIMGLLFLLAPFIIVIISFIVPDFNSIIKNLSKDKANKSIDKERIIYHEAGHFLCGYLCGIPIVGYDVNGDRDAGTYIIASIPNVDKNNYNKSQIDILKDTKIGSLLIVAMAGVVAESLRFGDCCGGIEDFPLAVQILKRYGVSDNDVDDYLRWGVLKALVLLRINRDLLDSLSDLMRRGQSVEECIVNIERQAVDSLIDK